MAMQSTTNPADVANRLRTYFSKQLLYHVINKLVMEQFATTEDLPANSSSKTMRFFRKRSAQTSDVVTPTEGVAISTFTEVTMGYVDVTLQQRAEAAKISDILRLIDMYKPLQQNIETMGEDAALDFDTITRNAIVTGMNASNGNFERFAGVTNTGTSSTDFTTFNALTAANAKITRARALACITQLKRSKVPMLNGGYVAVTPPEVMHDIRQDTDWVTAAARVNDGRALYKNEVVTLDGVTYVEHTNPFIEKNAYGTFDSTGTNYTTLFLGRGAYGTPKLTGTTSPLRPQIMICDTPDKSDPANQFVTAAWKAYYNAVLLKTNLSGDIPFLVQFRSKTTFA